MVCMDASPARRKIIYICMGSACHQLGVMQVLPLLETLIQENDLQERLELKGAFCLGGCGRGIVLKIDDQEISGVNPKNLRRKFLTEILPLIQEGWAE